MTLSSRTSIENGLIVAWVDLNEKAWIEQPFNPSNNAPWATEMQALEWADNWIEEYNNRPEPTPLD